MKSFQVLCKGRLPQTDSEPWFLSWWVLLVMLEHRPTKQRCSCFACVLVVSSLVLLVVRRGGGWYGSKEIVLPE